MFAALFVPDEVNELQLQPTKQHSVIMLGVSAPHCSDWTVPTFSLLQNPPACVTAHVQVTLSGCFSASSPRGCRPETVISRMRNTWAPCIKARAAASLCLSLSLQCPLSLQIIIIIYVIQWTHVSPVFVPHYSVLGNDGQLLNTYLFLVCAAHVTEHWHLDIIPDTFTVTRKDNYSRELKQEHRHLQEGGFITGLLDEMDLG